MTRVAIIGAGVAGMGAARKLLEAGIQVELFEASHRVGGDCFGVDVPMPGGGTYRIDAGVSDFNRATFVRTGPFIAALGLDVRPIVQDASFMTPDGATAWFAGRGEMHLVSDALRAEIVRFRRTAVTLLDDERHAAMTCAAYLAHEGYSDEFFRLYFAPRAAGAFPMPDGDAGAYLIRSMVAFWRMHGVVGAGAADRVCVVGGMHLYCERFASWFTGAGGILRCAHDVAGIVRRGGGVEIRAVTSSGEHRLHRADHVLVATNASDVLGLLDDPSAQEQALYPQFPCQRAHLVVHRDPALMPRDRNHWGAFNYVVEHAGVPSVRPTITFYPNLLASLPPEVPDVFVTMNPFRPPAEESVIAHRFFVHPVASGKTAALAAQIGALQGTRNTWYAGSYLIEPFVHEQALESGQTTADALLATVG